MKAERGFTVIELMLFLGVSGALFAALMFGVSSSVSQQRYRESVVGFSTFLQGQYSEVSNTRNDSDNDWNCTKDGTVEQNGEGTFRGTSQCVLLGEAIQIKDGNQIDVYRVIGCEPLQNAAQSSSNSGGCGNTNVRDGEDKNDLDTLKSYNPKVTDFNHQQESLEWNSTLATTTEKHDPLTASFLILRSPSSGLLRVFTTTTTLPNNLNDMLTVDGAKTVLPMCMLGDSIIAAKQSIAIDPSISGPDGVIVNQSDGLCV